MLSWEVVWEFTGTPAYPAFKKPKVFAPDKDASLVSFTDWSFEGFFFWFCFFFSWSIAADWRIRELDFRVFGGIVEVSDNYVVSWNLTCYSQQNNVEKNNHSTTLAFTEWHVHECSSGYFEVLNVTVKKQMSCFIFFQWDSLDNTPRFSEHSIYYYVWINNCKIMLRFHRGHLFSA